MELGLPSGPLPFRPSTAGAWVWTTAVAVALGAALSGCVGNCHADMLVEGTGYQLTHILEWNGTSGIRMADADFSPDGKMIGVLLSNGTVQFWTSAGALMHNRPWNWSGAQPGRSACNESTGAIRFLNSTAAAVGCGVELRGITVLCEVLWHATIDSELRIGGMAVTDGGGALVLLNKSGPAVLWGVHEGQVTALSAMSPPADAVAASPSGTWIATIGRGIRIEDAHGENVLQADQMGLLRSGIAFSDDEIFRLDYHNRTALDLDVLIDHTHPADMGFTARLPIRNASLLPDLGTEVSVVGGRPDWHGRPPLLVVSASGQYVAIQAAVPLWFIDYGSSANVIVVANRSDHDHLGGFHVMENARVRLDDNGTALAISSSPWGLWLTRAGANATLPVRGTNPSPSLC